MARLCRPAKAGFGFYITSIPGGCVRPGLRSWSPAGLMVVRWDISCGVNVAKIVRGHGRTADPSARAKALGRDDRFGRVAAPMQSSHRGRRLEAGSGLVGQRTQHSAPKAGAACWAILLPSRRAGTRFCVLRLAMVNDSAACCDSCRRCRREAGMVPRAQLHPSARAEALGRDDRSKKIDAGRWPEGPLYPIVAVTMKSRRRAEAGSGFYVESLPRTALRSVLGYDCGARPGSVRWDSWG